MANDGVPTVEAPGKQETGSGTPAQGRSKDEIAFELMKFIAVTTGYGKGAAAVAGFSAKPAARTAEEHAEALLELFERCRGVLNKT